MLIYGKAIADGILEVAKEGADALRARGVIPTLAIGRIGENDADEAYENSIKKTIGRGGVRFFSSTIPITSEHSQFERMVSGLNLDDLIHGVLLLRPLPAHIDEERIKAIMLPERDVDGITDVSMAGVYALASGSSLDRGFAPCTAEAVARVLGGAGIKIAGKRAVVIGRSLVVGKPAAMLLLREGATVTIAHSRTKDLASVTREADIVVVCAGLAAEGRDKRLGAGYFKAGQTIIDCGINTDADGVYGDVDTGAADALGADITPVPGGLGAVTTALLAEHTVKAALRANVDAKK
ncbi:MAG: bifunctional 5,10-methylenetetrahydrofolate dehydrogenase/5,10-methenyltetrahydrofolate cyclohydrolase [Clostridiales Family XIII bacterium]|jgi:methylenetetrahydrofolate dehydrogenase (NADP+)/methenyltetrahydrofolate cyclohydrolase|nr:bifunctional 5,10-methylenetetrahydrofolate dehydrogenase/5,10-methenyltetrahydrofolate cyclohydrolase [Clostridiales Family XIII bacterium]